MFKLDDVCVDEEVFRMELSQYRNECEMLREEVSRVTVQLERTREELAATEAASNQQHTTMTQHLNAAQTALQQEKLKLLQLHTLGS